ncbi:hypothetical protein GQX74_011816 [Glossina fuscipes]|nr:hypothetical protein GQX74_011816 [Glossina fuscipes]
MIRKLTLGRPNVAVNTIGLSVLTKILWPPVATSLSDYIENHCTEHVAYKNERKKEYFFNACLRCQAENKRDLPGRQDCVVVWGECNHSFHHCCMSLWVKQNNRCPLCQQEWSIQRMGK